jgi:CBS domain-containing protein
MSRRLNAGEVCTRNVTYAYKSMPVNEAARLMREQHVGSLVVVEETEQGRVAVGMLTDRDIVTGIVAKDIDARMVRVEDAMSGDLVTVREQDSTTDVLGLMRRKGVRRIPVVDGKGALVGLVALDDLLELVADELRLVVQAIEVGRKREPVMRP